MTQARTLAQEGVSRQKIASVNRSRNENESKPMVKDSLTTSKISCESAEDNYEQKKHFLN